MILKFGLEAPLILILLNNNIYVDIISGGKKCRYSFDFNYSYVACMLLCTFYHLKYLNYSLLFGLFFAKYQAKMVNIFLLLKSRDCYPLISIFCKIFMRYK